MIMKKAKKSISVLVALAMVITLIPAMTSTAEADTKETGYNYTMLRTPTATNCIDYVEFIEMSDYTYTVRVHLDPSVYGSDKSKIQRWRLGSNENDVEYYNKEIGSTNGVINCTINFSKASSIYPKGGYVLQLVGSALDADGKYISNSVNSGNVGSYAAGIEAGYLLEPELGNVISARYDRATINFNSPYTSSYDHLISVVEPDGYYIYRNGSRIGTVAYKGQGLNHSYTDSGLTPKTSYKYQVVPYKTIGGNTYTTYGYEKTGHVTPFTAPTAVATKIASNKARITITVPTDQRFKNASKFYVYKGSKKIKTVKNNGKAKISVTYKKSKAGSSKYKVKAVCAAKTSVTATGKTFKPKSNTRSWGYSSKPSRYRDFNEYYRPVKVYYSNGKLKVKSLFINTHIFKLSKYYVKVTVKCQGKTIGKTTAKCRNLKSDRTKRQTVTISKCKKGYDLRNGGVVVSWKTVKVKL